MKKKAIFAIVFSLFVISFLKVVPISPVLAEEPQFDPSGAISIENQFCISHGNSRIPELADFVEGFGAKINRNNIMWNQVEEPYGSNNYIWQYYDDMYSNDSARGIEHLGVFVFGRGGWPDSNYVAPSEYTEWLMFVEAFVNRYKDNLTYYEMWNEPDIGFWDGTDDEFFYFLNMTTHKVLELDNDAIILSPGVSGPDWEYLDKMISWFGDEAFNSLFDIIAFHSYPNRNPEHLTYRIEQVKCIAENHHFKGEYWITEIGFTTSVRTEEQVQDYIDEVEILQAESVLKHYTQSIHENMSAIFWYDLLDWCGDPYYGEEWFGLITCDYWNVDHWEYKYKPAGHAYDKFCSMIQDGTYFPRGSIVQSITPENIWCYYFYTPKNTTVIVAWSQSSASMASISFNLPGHSTPEFDIRDHWYTTYLYKTKENLTRYDFELTNSPVLFEIDFSDYFSAEGLNDQPITLFLNVSHDTFSFIYIVSVVVLLVGAIALVSLKYRKRRIVAKSTTRKEESS